MCNCSTAMLTVIDNKLANRYGAYQYSDYRLLQTLLNLGVPSIDDDHRKYIAVFIFHNVTFHFWYSLFVKQSALELVAASSLNKNILGINGGHIVTMLCTCLQPLNSWESILIFKLIFSHINAYCLATP